MSEMVTGDSTKPAWKTSKVKDPIDCDGNKLLDPIMKIEFLQSGSMFFDDVSLDMFCNGLKKIMASYKEQEHD